LCIAPGTSFSGNLLLSSNDPYESVLSIALIGTGIHPGDIDVSVDSLIHNTPPGGIDSQSITIENSGLGMLNYDLTFRNVWDTTRSEPVKAFVLDSWGTDYNTSAWQYINSNFTDVIIDYSVLNKHSITYEDIAETEADVLIISDAWSNTQSYLEFTTA